MSAAVRASAAPSAGAAPAPEPEVAVCALVDLRPASGVAALVRGEPVAVVRTGAGELFALGNVDPATGASVLSRGLVGDRTVDGERVPYLASPMLKHPYALRDGRCLDDPALRVATYDVVVRRGVVHVGARRAHQP